VIGDILRRRAASRKPARLRWRLTLDVLRADNIAELQQSNQQGFTVRKPPPLKPEPLPAEIPGRLALVGATLYGKSWRRRLAEGLHVSRSTLWQWLSGAGKRRDIDGDLMELLDCERDAASERALQIAARRRRFMIKRGA
jgi:hypothetical protein